MSFFSPPPPPCPLSFSPLPSPLPPPPNSKRQGQGQGQDRQADCTRRAGAAGGAVTPPPEVPQPPGVQFTQDDAGARQALGNGLMLSDPSGAASPRPTTACSSIPTAFKAYQIHYNPVSGEVCKSKSVGTWSVNSGYRFDEGGGIAAIVNINAGSSNGTEILGFANADPGHVYVGRNEVQFDINPEMRDTC